MIRVLLTEIEGIKGLLDLLIYYVDSYQTLMMRNETGFRPQKKTETEVVSACIRKRYQIKRKWP
jgi:hypothetical protein